MTNIVSENFKVLTELGDKLQAAGFGDAVIMETCVQNRRCKRYAAQRTAAIANIGRKEFNALINAYMAAYDSCMLPELNWLLIESGNGDIVRTSFFNRIKRKAEA